MTRRISWISWTQYHKVSFNFNSQHPHPPHQQLFISIQLPYISNGCDSRTGLFSKLPHKCEHYMNKCVYRSLGINAIFPILQVWEGQLLSPVKTTSPTFNTSEQIQSSSLQSRLSSCHCQWLHKLVKNLYPYFVLDQWPPQLTLIVWDGQSVVFGRIEVSLPQMDLWCITVHIRKRSWIQHGLYLK